MRALPSIAAAALVAGACVAHADTVALTSTRTVGNQSWTGAMGMDFDVLTAITITQLGAFDSGQDGFSGTIQVGIFNRNTQTLVGTAGSFTSLSQPLVGNSRYLDIPDFTLAPGNYSIVAVGFSGSDPNGNATLGGTAPSAGMGGGLINFVGSSRWGLGSGLTFPSNLDNGSPTLYDAGTFQFTTAVPDVGTRVQLLVGMIALALALRSARRRSLLPA